MTKKGQTVLQIVYVNLLLVKKNFFLILMFEKSKTIEDLRLYLFQRNFCELSQKKPLIKKNFAKVLQ